MKLRRMPILLVVVVAALSVPTIEAQRTGFAVGIAPASAPGPQFFARQPFRMQTPLVTSPIMPMSNPIQPILPSPFISTFPQQRVIVPTVIIVPSHPHQGHPSNRVGAAFRRRPVNTFSQTTIIAPNSTVFAPASTVIAPNSAVVAPGPLPYSQPYPYVYSQPVAAAPDVYVAPEPRVPVIAPEPRVRPYTPPPPIGTSRADVISMLGNPIGTVGRPSTETLYFDGGMIVVLQAGRVIQVR